MPVADGAGATTEEGDSTGVGAGRVPAGDTELVGLALVGFGVLVGLVRVVGFGVAAGADVAATGPGAAGDGVVAGAAGSRDGGLTSR